MPVSINIALGPLPTPTRRLLWAAEGSGTMPQQLAERLAFEQDDDEGLVHAVLERLRARRQLMGQVTELVSRCMDLDAEKPAIRVADVTRDEEAATMVGGALRVRLAGPVGCQWGNALRALRGQRACCGFAS